jgi:hypothetical protein
MKFGYLIVVSTNSTSTIDYPMMAYALALSIKNTQKEGYDSVALVINDKSKLDKFKSKWVFDYIIEEELPDHWDGRSYMDQLTPFDATVCLDADMLFLRDYSHWAEYFIENCDLYVANKSYTYRGEVVTGDFYRRAFVKNNLPNLYSFYTFFKKDSELAKEFFTLGRAIIKNPTEFSNSFLSNYKPTVVGTDEAFALAAKILDISDEIAYDIEFPRVAHLKGMIQNWPWPAENFSDHAGFYFNTSGQLKIGNYHQNDIVHYVDKSRITPEIVSILEEIAWQK